MSEFLLYCGVPMCETLRTNLVLISYSFGEEWEVMIAMCGGVVVSPRRETLENRFRKLGSRVVGLQPFLEMFHRIIPG